MMCLVKIAIFLKTNKQKLIITCNTAVLWKFSIKRLNRWNTCYTHINIKVRETRYTGVRKHKTQQFTYEMMTLYHNREKKRLFIKSSVWKKEIFLMSWQFTMYIIILRKKGIWKGQKERILGGGEEQNHSVLFNKSDDPLVHIK